MLPTGDGEQQLVYDPEAEDNRTEHRLLCIVGNAVESEYNEPAGFLY